MAKQKGIPSRHKLRVPPKYTDEDEIDTLYAKDRIAVDRFEGVTRTEERGILRVDIYHLIGQKGYGDLQDSVSLVIKLHETKNGNRCDDYCFTGQGVLLSHRYRKFDGDRVSETKIDRDISRYVSRRNILREMIAKHQSKRMLNQMLISFFQSNPVLTALNPNKESSS